MFQFVLSNLYRKSKYKKNVTNKVNKALKHCHWVQIQKSSGKWFSR